MWARKTVATESCPKSYITAESEWMVEDFLVRRRVGGTRFEDLSARQVEAFAMLEEALDAETRDGRRGSEGDGRAGAARRMDSTLRR